MALSLTNANFCDWYSRRRVCFVPCYASISRITIDHEHYAPTYTVDLRQRLDFFAVGFVDVLVS